MQEKKITDPMVDLDKLLHDLEMLADTFIAISIALTDGDSLLPKDALYMPIDMLREKTRLAYEAYKLLRRPAVSKDELTADELQLLAAYRRATQDMREYAYKLLFE